MITQADFHELDHNQWVHESQGYRIVIRKVDESVEVIIRASLTHDPDAQDWVDALITVNSFYQKLRLGEKYE